MKIELNRMSKPAALVAAFTMAFSLGACSRNDDRTVGQKVDAAVDSSHAALNNATQQANIAAADITKGSKEVASEASDKIADAAITASVNGDLTKDPDLSALKVNVDTTNGHVVLHGTAPSDDARQRATKLASNTKGVTSVDNELTIAR